jgi:hypothetical protein
VAVLALHLELSGVEIVPEEDRLAGTLERGGILDGEAGGGNRIGDGRTGPRLLRSRRRSGRHQGRDSDQRGSTDGECKLAHYRAHLDEES